MATERQENREKRKESEEKRSKNEFEIDGEYWKLENFLEII